MKTEAGRQAGRQVDRRLWTVGRILRAGSHLAGSSPPVHIGGEKTAYSPKLKRLGFECKTIKLKQPSISIEQPGSGGKK